MVSSYAGVLSRIFHTTMSPGVNVHHGEHKDLNTGYGGDICNIGFIIGSKGVAVIDTGGSPKIGASVTRGDTQNHQAPYPLRDQYPRPSRSLSGQCRFQTGSSRFCRARQAVWRHDTAQGNLSSQTDRMGRCRRGRYRTDTPTLQVTPTHDIELGRRILRLTAYSVAHSPTD